MNNIVGLKELRENMPAFVNKVNKGNSFIVVRKSKPVFKISPISDDDSLWETIIDFTKINNGGVEVNDLLKRL